MQNELEIAFHRYFEVLQADTPSLRNEAYRLRYQVYCIEHPFEDAGQFPDNLEVDQYDRHAAHAIVRHRESGLIAGTVRLVLPDKNDLNSRLPIETHCSESFAQAGLDPDKLERHSLAEISRFAVSKEFRRRAGENSTISGVGPDPDAYRTDVEGGRILPHLTLGLFIAIVQMSAQHGITQWYAVMEPALLRLLGRFGIRFQRIGGPIEYHGRRQPCYGEVNDVLEGIWRRRREVWELITNKGSVWPPPAIDLMQDRKTARKM